MSYTLEDAEREAGEERLITQVLEDHRDVIVAEFVEDRLASYYEEHPDLAGPAEQAHAEARKIYDVSYSASLVFAFSSTEIVIQDLLLKPVVVGLTHNPDLSDLMAALINIRSQQTEKFLFYIMEEVGLPDIKEQKLPNGHSIWKEKNIIQDIRNKILHRGTSATKEEAERALVLGKYFLCKLYPTVRGHFTQRSSGWT